MLLISSRVTKSCRLYMSQRRNKWVSFFYLKFFVSLSLCSKSSNEESNSILKAIMANERFLSPFLVVRLAYSPNDMRDSLTELTFRKASLKTPDWGGSKSLLSEFHGGICWSMIGLAVGWELIMGTQKGGVRWNIAIDKVFSWLFPHSSYLECRTRLMCMKSTFNRRAW